MGMSMAKDGLSNTQRRTRDALISAARDLVTAGEAPTVEGAARAAAVSRTTAYRYFPNRTALLVAAHPEVAMTSMLADDAPADPIARLDAVVDQFITLILETEAQQRTMLRLSLESDPQSGPGLPLRQGRAIAWIAEALEPLQGQFTAAELRRLALAIRSVAGIEALVWLCDVPGLARDDAAVLMRWSARSVLRAAMTWGPPTPGSARSADRLTR